MIGKDGDPMTWYDFSLPVQNGMPVYPGDPAVQIQPFLTHAANQLQASQLAMSCHAGTHLDAPRHFLPAGASVDQLALDQLCGPALIVACPWQPGRLLDLSALDLAALRSGDALLLATGWDSRAGSALYYEELPQFAPGSTALLKRLGLRLFGLDLPTVIEASEPPQSAAMHLGLLSAGVVIVESLAGLLPLAGRRIEFQALPLRLTGCDGSPVRACGRLLAE